MRDPRDRLQELLACRATQELDASEKKELVQLLQDHPDWAADSFELTAASLELALNEQSPPLPESLRRKVAADARQYFSKTRQPSEPIRLVQPSKAQEPSGNAPGATRQSALWMGWLAAAALLVVTLMSWLPGLLQSPAGPLQARQELMAQDSEALILDWQATEDPAAQGASGDVLWSVQQQAGFMRIQGLQPNNPSRRQYQLWIFDRLRDERYPVDGGVFDIPAGADEVIVPIQAKLPVSEAHLFAVTVEQPGGVVVSSRARIVLLANRDPG